MEAGDLAVIRHVLRGRVGWVRPAVVVFDGQGRVELFRSPGPVKRPARDTLESLISSLAAGNYDVVDATWEHTHVLEIARAGRWSSVWPMWFERSWQFAGWYVNFQEPLRRSRLGWDTFDLALDIVVSPDLGWRWKDEDHFAMLCSVGVVSPEAADEVRREGERVIDDIDNARYPFDSDWAQWRPSPSWRVPSIPEDWDAL